MSSSDSKLLTYAIKEAEQAVNLERQGQLQQAMNKYIRAAEILIEFVKYTKNQIMKKKCEDKIVEYMERAKQIQYSTGGSRRKRASIAKVQVKWREIRRKV